MNIRKLTLKDRHRIREIWKECFNDSDSFLDEYFTKAVSYESGFGLEESGILVSDLFILNFWVKIFRNRYVSPFLAGCATIKQARNKNYMRDLIYTVLLKMSENHLPVTFLHPFLHSFYRKFGYETIAYINDFNGVKYNGKLNIKTVINKKDAPVAHLLSSYLTNMKNYDNCFLRDERRIDAILSILFSDGGKLLLCENDGFLSYALCYDHDEYREIFEIIVNNEESLYALSSNNDINETNYFLPSSDNFKTRENNEFTMMRVVCPEGALKNCKLLTSDEIIIYIDDIFLKRKYNLLIKPGVNSNYIIDSDGTPDIYTDINLLAQLITGTYPANTPTLIQKIFSRGKSCFYDTY